MESKVQWLIVRILFFYVQTEIPSYKQRKEGVANYFSILKGCTTQKVEKHCFNQPI